MSNGTTHTYMHYTTLFVSYEGRFSDDFPCLSGNDSKKMMIVSAVDSAVPREIMARKLGINNKSWHLPAAVAYTHYHEMGLKIMAAR